jgi:hypothetical protein
MILRLIGYWKNDWKHSLPDPADFVDADWDAAEREKVIAHLKSGITMPYAAGGKSWCRFGCTKVDMGNMELTDGVYLWPQGLVHYLEYHDLRLPHPVTQHMLNNGNRHQDKIADITPDNFVVDFEWWEGQGWSHNKGHG